MRNILLDRSRLRTSLLSLLLALGMGETFAAVAQKTLQKITYDVSPSKAVSPDSCVTFYPGGLPFSKSVFQYNSSGLLARDAQFAWDTATQLWQPRYQTEYSYDASGNLLSDIATRYDESDNSSLYYKNIFAYTAKNDLSAQEYYVFDSDKHGLVGVSRFEYFYNPAGSPDSVIEYSKSDLLNNWIPSSKSIYGYTNDTIQSSCEMYKYNATANEWMKYIKNVQTYDSDSQVLDEQNYTASNDNQWTRYSRTINEYLNGKLASSVTYNSDGVDWVAASRTLYGYRTGKLVAKVTSLYNPNPSVWINAFKDSIEYLTDGKLAKQTAFKWNANSENWVAVARDIHTYDSGNAHEQYFYSSAGAWIGTQKSIMRYDASGNNTSEEKYGWNNETNSWIPSAKTEKVYDGETQKINSSIKYSLGNNNSWQGYVRQDYEYELLQDSSVGLKFVRNYDSDGAGWSNLNYTQFFYSTRATSITDRQDLNLVRIAWFPEQIITVESDVVVRQVSVYFVNGTQKFAGKSQRISTDGWEKGIYIVKVETADGKRTVKKINIL